MSIRPVPGGTPFEQARERQKVCAAECNAASRARNEVQKIFDSAIERRERVSKDDRPAIDAADVAIREADKSLKQANARCSELWQRYREVAAECITEYRRQEHR